MHSHTLGVSTLSHPCYRSYLHVGLMPVSTLAQQEDRRPFYARLPRQSYLKLRRLAGLPKIEVRSARKAVLIRLPVRSYERLRKIALARSGPAGHIASMRGTLAQMIADAPVAPNGESGMLDVVVALIDKTPIHAA